MSEEKVIQQLKTPHTRSNLHNEFVKLGIKKGMVIIVHTSLSSFGWVCGGPIAIIQALMDSVGEEGTIVMPTQTADNTDPANWKNPPVPEEWWPIIREEMPAYDPQITPTRGMGKVAETFRAFPGVFRSEHPTYSFAAWGKHAAYIISSQPLKAGFGEESPLAKIYELDGRILLLGVQHDSNTSLHLAEHEIPNRESVQKGTSMLENGIRVWKTYEEIVYDSDVFNELGKDFEETHSINRAMIGNATCKLIEQRSIVDYSRKWLQQKDDK